MGTFRPAVARVWPIVGWCAVLSGLGLGMFSAVTWWRTIPDSALQPSGPTAATPRDVYAAFRHAVATQDWRGQFECLTPQAQATLMHRLVLSALLLEFELDLYVQIERVLERHHIPDTALQEFWPDSRRFFIATDDPEKLQQWQQAHLQRMERWTSQIMPRIHDGPALIAELQPLLEEGARRLPESSLAREISTFRRYAYGRLRTLEVAGDQASAEIRIKLLDGAYVQADSLQRSAGSTESTVGLGHDPEVLANLVLVDPNAYGDLWGFAQQVQQFLRAVPHPQLVLIGLGSGDLAVEMGLNKVSIEGEHGEPDQVYTLTPLRNSDEAEFDFSNSGVQTVRASHINFQRIDGAWRIADYGR